MTVFEIAERIYKLPKEERDRRINNLSFQTFECGGETFPIRPAIEFWVDHYIKKLGT